MPLPMQVVTHPDYDGVGRRLAPLLDAELILGTTKRFPDGEVYARLPADTRLEPGTVVVGATRGNDRLIETLFLLDAVQRAGGRTPRLLLPYVAYARQDRLFEPGESVSAAVVGRALGHGLGLVVGLDVHAPGVLDHFGCDARQASAVEDLARHLATLGVDTVLAPDKGALERARAAAGVLGCPWDALEKTRLSSTEVRMQAKSLDVAGRTVAIVDDIISTGGTMATAAGELKRQGAARVVVAATHGLFSDGALERLSKGGVDEVVTTDSVPNPAARVTSCLLYTSDAADE